MSVNPWEKLVTHIYQKMPPATGNRPVMRRCRWNFVTFGNDREGYYEPVTDCLWNLQRCGSTGQVDYDGHYEKVVGIEVIEGQHKMECRL